MEKKIAHFTKDAMTPSPPLTQPLQKGSLPIKGREFFAVGALVGVKEYIASLVTWAIFYSIHD